MILMTLKQVLEFVPVSMKTLLREIDDGKIRTTRIRGRVLVAQDDLNAYLADQKQAH